MDFLSVQARQEEERCLRGDERGDERSSLYNHMVEGIYFTVKKKTHSDIKAPCVFSLSKKTFKTAVLRNKIKRQIRTIIKKTEKENTPILLVPKKEIINKPFKEIEQDLINVLKKI